VRDGAIGTVLSIFAPRDPAEVARVMAVGGVLVAVTPRSAHLGELRARLTMVTVDDGKADRLVEKFEGLLRPAGQQEVTFELRLGHRDVAGLVGMGPSARHLSSADLERQIRALPDELIVTAAVTISTFVQP
jgi:23S rRNA (guanine745-N1)-methyltransferase